MTHRRAMWVWALVLVTASCGQAGPGGVAKAKVRGPAEVLWSFDTGGCIASSPAIVGGSLAVGSCTGSFYLLDGRTGGLKWKYDTRKDAGESRFPGDPVAAEDLVVAGTQAKSSGHVYAFDAATGQVRWKHEVGADPNGEAGLPKDVVRQGDSLYGVGMDGKLFCLDLRTGRLNWSFEGAEPRSAPAVEGDRVFVAGSGSKVYGLEAGTGTVIWETDLEAAIVASLAARGGRVYAGTSPFQIFSLDVQTGAIAGKIPLQGKPVGALVAGPDALYAFLRTAKSDVEADMLIAAGLDLKRILWGRKAHAEWKSPHPEIWRDVVLAADRTGELIAFGRADGVERWTLTFEEALQGIRTAEDVLYIGTVKGPIHAIVPKAAGRS